MDQLHHFHDRKNVPVTFLCLYFQQLQGFQPVFLVKIRAFQFCNISQSHIHMIYLMIPVDLQIQDLTHGFHTSTFRLSVSSPCISFSVIHVSHSMPGIIRDYPQEPAGLPTFQPLPHCFQDPFLHAAHLYLRDSHTFSHFRLCLFLQIPPDDQLSF